jgi:hypothetical protein
MAKSRLAELGILSFQDKRARVTLKNGEVFECKPAYLGDSDEEDENGITIPDFTVITENDRRRSLMERDILKVEEIE